MGYQGGMSEMPLYDAVVRELDIDPEQPAATPAADAS